MATETLYPDALLDQSNLDGSASDLESSGQWLTAQDDSDDTEFRASFPSPDGPLDGTQTITLVVRRTDNSTREPDVTVELWEDGSQVSTLGSFALTSASGQTETFTFDATDVTDGADVEIRVSGSSTGGPGAQRNTAEFDTLEWEAQTTELVLGSASGAGQGLGSASGEYLGSLPVTPEFFYKDYPNWEFTEEVPSRDNGSVSSGSTRQFAPEPADERGYDTVKVHQSSQSSSVVDVRVERLSSGGSLLDSSDYEVYEQNTVIEFDVSGWAWEDGDQWTLRLRNDSIVGISYAAGEGSWVELHPSPASSGPEEGSASGIGQGVGSATGQPLTGGDPVEGMASGAGRGHGDIAGSALTQGQASGAGAGHGSAAGESLARGVASGAGAGHGSASADASATGQASAAGRGHGSATGQAPVTGSARGIGEGHAEATASALVAGSASGAGAGLGTVAAGGVSVGRASGAGQGHGSASGQSPVSGSASGVGQGHGSVAGEEIAPPSGNPFYDALLNDTPVAAWFFEEDSGSTISDEVGSHDGTVSGATLGVDSGEGNFGKGARFDGTDDRIAIPHSSDFYFGSRGEFTIAVAAKIDTIDSVFRRLVSFEDGSDGWNFHIHDGSGLRGERWAGGNNKSAALSDPDTDQVYLLHLTYEGSGGSTDLIRLYVDGVEVDSSNSPYSMADPGEGLDIGRRVYDQTRYFHGDIYTFAIYDHELSATEVQAHYDAAYQEPDEVVEGAASGTGQGHGSASGQSPTQGSASGAGQGLGSSQGRSEALSGTITGSGKGSGSASGTARIIAFAQGTGAGTGSVSGSALVRGSASGVGRGVGLLKSAQAPEKTSQDLEITVSAPMNDVTIFTGTVQLIPKTPAKTPLSEWGADDARILQQEFENKLLDAVSGDQPTLIWEIEDADTEWDAEEPVLDRV